MNDFLGYFRALLLYMSLFFTVTHKVTAQQQHHWATQYGARSSLMGGAVIAGVNDNSAVYYNPAAVASLENTLSLNANLYQLTWFNVKNGLGQGIHMDSFGFDLYPQFAGGTISFKDPRFKMGYMLMTRNYHYLKLDGRHEKFHDAIPNILGNEEFIGTFDYLSRANEQWVGLAMAYRLTEQFSMGFTQIFGYRFQNFRATVIAEAITTDPNNFYTAAVRDHYEMSLDNIKALWKIGIRLDLKPLKLGLTFTTPSVNINPFNLSTGRARRESSVSNLNIGLPQPDYSNFLATDKQDKIPSVYKQPMSIGLGIEYELPKTKLAFAAEYFHQLTEYRVLSAQSRPVVRPSNVFRNISLDDFLSFSNKATTVTNFALGVEHRMGEQWSLLAGFRTDFNAYNEEGDLSGTFASQSLAYWDLFHTSAGITFHKRQSDFTIGLSYYWGVSYDNYQFFNFDAPSDLYYFDGTVNETASTTTRSISLIVGYTHYLKPRVKK